MKVKALVTGKSWKPHAFKNAFQLTTPLTSISNHQYNDRLGDLTGLQDEEQEYSTHLG